MFEAIKIGLLEYQTRLPGDSPAAENINLELAKMNAARTTLLNTFLASDTAVALKDTSFRLDVLEEDVESLHEKVDQAVKVRTHSQHMNDLCLGRSK